MSKKFVGKVLASLALGGAALLVAPGVAMASDGAPSGDWAKGHDDKGYSQCKEWDGKKDQGDASGWAAPGGEAPDGAAPDGAGAPDGEAPDAAPMGEAPKAEAPDAGAPKEEAPKEESAKKDGDKKDGDKKDGDKKECDAPKGWVDGGDAGIGTDPKLAATGIGLVGTAALGGLVLLRRRRTDGAVA